jgi:hypothetical protein
VAAPHVAIESKVQVIPYRNIDNIGPAGSINSNVLEMAKWVRLQLNEGRNGKERLISNTAIKEMHTPQIVSRRGGGLIDLNLPSHFNAYGLGWGMFDYRGRKVVAHGGGIDGMVSTVTLVPEEKLGWVILTNLSSQVLPQALDFRLLDAYLGAPAKDWSADLRKVMRLQEVQSKVSLMIIEGGRIKGTKPSLALEKYAGTYRDDLMGDVVISREKDKLTLRFGGLFLADLDHWHYDSFMATFRDRTAGKAIVSLSLDYQGKPDEIKIPALENLVAKRVPGTSAPPRKTSAP